MRRKAVVPALGGLFLVCSFLLTGCEEEEGIYEPPPYVLSGTTRHAISGATLNGVGIFFQDSVLVTVSAYDGSYNFAASFTLTPALEFSFKEVGYGDRKLVFPRDAQKDSLDDHRYTADVALSPL